jgi:hypothetical protein
LAVDAFYLILQPFSGAVDYLVVLLDRCRFEFCDHEPSLLVLLRYARFAGVSMEMLVDDKMDLPETLPAVLK